MVYCCQCFTWSLSKTMSFISIFILICKYNSVRKVSVLNIAVRGDDTLKQTRPYDSHLSNITVVWNYPSPAIMKTSVVLFFMSTRPCSANSIAQFLNTAYYHNIYTYIQSFTKKKWFHSFLYNFEILLHSTALLMLRQKFTRTG